MTETQAGFSPAVRRQLLDAVSQTVQARLFDPHWNGRNWPALVREHEEAILRATAPTEFESRMQALVETLGVQPVGFCHRSRARVPIQHALRATLFPDPDRWVFQDVHQDGVAHAMGVEPGDILLAVAGESVIPPNPVRLSAGKAVTLTVGKRDGSVATLSAAIPASSAARPQLVHARTLDHGVGYLRISCFPGLVGVDLARDIDRAVQQLAGCRAAVVDLRGNPGGGSANLRLMSYLTPDRVPVGYSLTRPRAERGYRREELPQFRRIPRHKLSLLWLALRFRFVDKSIVVVTEGLPAPTFQGRVVLLVNEHTVSGSEIVAGFAKDHRLAVIVGSRTAGRLYGWSSIPIADEYRLTIPVSNYLTWEGKCWEGVGVEPDVTVPFSPEAARSGHDPQLEEAAQIAAGL